MSSAICSGISLSDFLDMTPSETILIMNDLNDMKFDDKNFNYKLAQLSAGCSKIRDLERVSNDTKKQRITINELISSISLIRTV